MYCIGPRTVLVCIEHSAGYMSSEWMTRGLVQSGREDLWWEVMGCNWKARTVPSTVPSAIHVWSPLVVSADLWGRSCFCQSLPPESQMNCLSKATQQGSGRAGTWIQAVWPQIPYSYDTGLAVLCAGLDLWNLCFAHILSLHPVVRPSGNGRLVLRAQICVTLKLVLWKTSISTNERFV